MKIIKILAGCIPLMLFAAGCGIFSSDERSAYTRLNALQYDYDTLSAGYAHLAAELKKMKTANFAEEMTYRNKLRADGKKITVGGKVYYYIGNAYGQKNAGGQWHGVIVGEIVWGDTLEHYASMLVFTENGRKISHYRGLFDRPARKLVSDPAVPIP